MLKLRRYGYSVRRVSETHPGYDSESPCRDICAEIFNYTTRFPCHVPQHVTCRTLVASHTELAGILRSA